jgi:DNA-binding CsgD family transcriptional regulator
LPLRRFRRQIDRQGEKNSAWEPVMQAHLDWAFAEKCDAAASVGEIAEMFTREIRALGFSYSACASHVDPLRPPRGAVMIVDYPKPWLERFSSMNYAQRDPVYLTACRQAFPFQWSDPRFRRGLKPDQLDILAEAAEMGLADGFTIPIHAPDALPASCSLAMSEAGVDPLNVRQAHWYALYAHEAVRSLLGTIKVKARSILSRRERQCIRLLAAGKDDFAISVLLGISEHTAHNYIRNAMRKFGVSTRMQAFVRALRSGEIRLEEIAD